MCHRLQETWKSFPLFSRGGWSPPCRWGESRIFLAISVRSSLFMTSLIFHSFPCIGAPPAYEFSIRVRFAGNRGANRCIPATTSSESAIYIPEDMSYLMDQVTLSALVESSSGSITSVPSFKDIVQKPPRTTPPPDVHSAASTSRPLLDLGYLSTSCSSRASSSPSDPRSGFDGNSFFMDSVPGNMSLLCQEPLDWSVSPETAAPSAERKETEQDLDPPLWDESLGRTGF